MSNIPATGPTRAPAGLVDPSGAPSIGRPTAVTDTFEAAGRLTEARAFTRATLARGALGGLAPESLAPIVDAVALELGRSPRLLALLERLGRAPGEG
jgi:hypothetical protein